MNHRQHGVRLLGAAAAGAVAGAGAGLLAHEPVAVQVIMGFDVAAALYLAMAWWHLIGAGQRLSAAAEEDQGHVAITAVVLLAAIFGLSAVGFLVSRIHNWDRLVLAIATIGLCWLLVQTVFAAHYANEYRQGLADDADRAGLDFPGGGPINFLDFAYFAFTVGLTFQVSDVTTNTAAMRRLVTLHALIAFLFNTAVIAMGVGAATTWF